MNNFQQFLQIAVDGIEACEENSDLLHMLDTFMQREGIDIYNTQMGSLGVGSILLERDFFAGINRLVLVAGCENCGNAHEDMICVQTDDAAFHYVKPERLHHAYKD